MADDPVDLKLAKFLPVCCAADTILFITEPYNVDPPPHWVGCALRETRGGTYALVWNAEEDVAGGV